MKTVYLLQAQSILDLKEGGKREMRKIACIALTLMMTLSFCGCTIALIGGIAASADKGDETEQAEQAEPKNNDSKPVHKANKDSKPKWEITSNQANAFVDSLGIQWVQLIVEITNTGDCDLYLESSSCDIEDTSGAIITSKSAISTYPSVLAPSEKGYMYDEFMLDYKIEGEVVAVPRFDVKASKIPLVRYNISDVELRDSQWGNLKVVGRIENTTDEVGELVYIVAMLYNAQGECIGGAPTLLPEDLQPHSKIGFEISTITQAASPKAADVASYIVYAYPWQMQF